MRTVAQLVNILTFNRTQMFIHVNSNSHFYGDGKMHRLHLVLELPNMLEGNACCF